MWMTVGGGVFVWLYLVGVGVCMLVLTCMLVGMRAPVTLMQRTVAPGAMPTFLPAIVMQTKRSAPSPSTSHPHPTHTSKQTHPPTRGRPRAVRPMAVPVVPALEHRVPVHGRGLRRRAPAQLLIEVGVS